MERIKDITNKLAVVQRRILKKATVIMVLLILLAIRTNIVLWQADYDDYYDNLKDANGVVNVLAMFSIIYFFTVFHFYNKFRLTFLKPVSFSIAWEYENGNLFILNNRGILNHIEHPPTPYCINNF